MAASYLLPVDAPQTDGATRVISVTQTVADRYSDFVSGSEMPRSGTRAMTLLAAAGLAAALGVGGGVMAQNAAQIDQAKLDADKAKRDADASQTGVADTVEVIQEVVRRVAKPKPTDKPLAPADVAAVDKARQAADAAEEFLRLAQDARKQADAALAAAAAAPNPAAQYVAYRDAQDKLRAVSTYVERAREIAVGPSPAAPQQAPRPGIAFGPEGEALRRLRQIAEDNAKAAPGGDLDVLLRHYDRKSSTLPVPERRPLTITPQGSSTDGPRPTATPPRQTSVSARVVEITAYDRRTQTVTLQGGRQIDVAPLARAMPRAPLFRPVPSPAGGAPVYRLDPGVQTALRSASGQDELRRVGGVALDVTFRSLDFAGVPDFIDRPGRTVVDQPVLLSLRALVARLEPHARDAASWTKLPPELRYPGGLARLYGFVATPDGDDLVLVGAVGAPDERIDIDSLILLLAAVWRDGVTPGVSLDPSPGNVAGPQYARVINLPANSTPARIMLEADHVMKQILFGRLRIAAPGYKSLASLYEEQPPAGPVAGRFWLTPVPLSAGSVAIAAAGSIGLVDSGVEARTEELSVATLQPLGRSTPQRERAAALFTDAIESMKSDPAISPGLYQRLHGLVDIVTIGALLRRQAIRAPVLERLTKLRYRELGAEAAPSSYPGVTVAITARDGSRRQVGLSGGVEMTARAKRRALTSFEDEFLAALQVRAAEPFQNGFLRPLGFPLSFPSLTQSAASRAAASAELQGRRLLLAGDAAGALRAFQNAVRLAPDWTDAWLGSAMAEARLKQFGRAHAALAKARSLDLSDTEAQVAELEIALMQNPAADMSAFEAGVLDELSRVYAERSFEAIGMGKPAIAKDWADRALAIAPDNYHAYIARTLAAAEDRSDDARRDAQQAVRILRLAQVRHGSDVGIRRALALATSLDAALRIGALSPLAILMVDPLPADDGIRVLEESLRQSAAQAASALALDAGLGFARFVELYARTIRIGILHKSGQAIAPANLRADVDDAMKRFPSMTAQFTYLAAHLDAIQRRPPDMIPRLDQSIAADPSFAEAINARAVVLAGMRRCAAARADLARLESLRVPVATEIRKQVAGCTS